MLGVTAAKYMYERLSSALDQQSNSMGFDLKTLDRIAPGLSTQADAIWEDVDKKFFSGKDQNPVASNVILEYMVAAYPGLSRKSCKFIVDSLGWDYH